MSEKVLLKAFKSIILLFLTSACFGPPIISKIGNLNINDYFYSSKVFMSLPNIEAESLHESEQIQSKKVYVPSIKIINKLLYMNNSKVDLNSPSFENEENNDKENSIAVRDREKDLPKRADIPAPSAPFGLSITANDANKTKEGTEKETTPTLQGVTMQGVSMN